MLILHIKIFIVAGVISYSSGHFGQGSGPIFINDVTCNGSESRLIDCVYDKNTTKNTHAEDAGVHCQPC